MEVGEVGGGGGGQRERTVGETEGGERGNGNIG